MAIRLATFNLKDFFAPRPDEEQASVAAKVDGVVQSLRRAGADVIALQEVGSIELLDEVIRRLPEFGYGPPVVGGADRRGIRNAIVSRLPIQWAQVHEAK